MDRWDEPFWVDDEGRRCFCLSRGTLSRLDAVRRLTSEPDRKRRDTVVWGSRLVHLFEHAFGPWLNQRVIGHELVRQ